MKIAIIVGSTRPGRKGSAVGRWVESAVAGRDASYELLELADYDLPLLGEATVPGAAKRQYETPQTQVWSRKIDEFDGFIFVTPEYNHGVPAALKNAFDVLYPEWGYKALGLVGYGADGGVRAIEQWRTITANAHLFAVRAQVSLSTFTDWDGDEFAPQERRAGELATVLTQVETMSGTLGSLRS